MMDMHCHLDLYTNHNTLQNDVKMKIFMSYLLQPHQKRGMEQVH